MTGVTNPATRHPAVLATTVATVQEESRRSGRARHRAGRHRAVPPRPQPDADRRLLPGGRAAAHLPERRRRSTSDGRPSRLRWLDRATQPPVPVDIAASGPKVIAFAARTVERVTFAVGADPERVAWALDLARTAMREAGRADDEVSFGAYVNVGCHPDPAVGAELIRGGLAAFAHFSAMPGSTGAGLAEHDRELRGRGRAALRQQPPPRRTPPTTRPCSTTSSSRPLRRDRRPRRRASPGWPSWPTSGSSGS